MSRISQVRNFCKDRRGGVLIYVALAIPVFLGVSGLAVDISVWHANKRSVQTLADAGAIAGASELTRMVDAANRETLADTAAREDATASGAKITDQIAVNIPPTSGDYEGATNAVEVIITREAPSLLSRVISPGDREVSARSVAFAAYGEYCVYALNNSAPNSLQVSGGASMTLGCGVAVNSNASAPDEALHVTGGGCLNASVIKVVGDYSSGGCYNDAEPFQGTEALANPLAGRFSAPAEASGACTTSGNIRVRENDEEPTADVVPNDIDGDGVYDLIAGRHCGSITVQKDGILRLAEGVHVFDKGIGVQGTVIEHPMSGGVTFYLGPDTGNSDTIDFQAEASVTISAPTTGPYANVLIYVDEAATGNVSHNFTAQTSAAYSGLIYMPGHDLNFAGDTTAGGEAVMLIADEIKLTGQADFANLETIPFFVDQEDLKPRLSE